MAVALRATVSSMELPIAARNSFRRDEKSAMDWVHCAQPPAEALEHGVPLYAPGHLRTICIWVYG